MFERVLDPEARLMLDISAWCTTMYVQHGVPNAYVVQVALLRYRRTGESTGGMLVNDA